MSVSGLKWTSMTPFGGLLFVATMPDSGLGGCSEATRVRYTSRRCRNVAAYNDRAADDAGDRFSRPFVASVVGGRVASFSQRREQTGLCGGAKCSDQIPLG